MSSSRFAVGTPAVASYVSISNQMDSYEVPISRMSGQVDDGLREGGMTWRFMVIFDLPTVARRVGAAPIGAVIH